MWQAWINVIAGVWAFISGLSIQLTTATNMFIIGAVMAIFGLWTPRQKWQGVVNGLLGVWLVISSFIPALRVQPNLLIIGAAVAILATWRAIETGQHRGEPAGQLR
jgi:hypothetical protein